MELLILKPQFKAKIWGSRFFKDEVAARLNEKIGEMWVVSAHREGDLVIAAGELAGRPLSKVYTEYPYLFNNPSPKNFPVLVKVIATSLDLSIQVHPDDTYAEKHENDSGKTEGWLILRAAPDARIVYGHHAKNIEEFIGLVNKKQYDRLLKVKPVKVGEFYPIPAGTVHTVGKNIVLLEIQQTSDLTYRLYDYDRPDLDGHLRPLHLDKAFDVISFNDVCCQHNVFITTEGKVIIGDNPYFKIILLNVNDEYIFTHTPHYRIATVIEGTFTVEDKTLTFGDSFIITSIAQTINIKGTGRIVLTIPHI